MIYIIVSGLASLFLIKNNLIYIYTSLALGAMLIANAYLHWRRVAEVMKQRPIFGVVVLINALISFMFGLVTIILAKNVNEYFVFMQAYI